MPKIKVKYTIEAENISKVYKLYEKPVDRLKESLSISGKKYHNLFYALKNVSFSIKPGETVGILGKNGSGKSTLLKIITGVLTPTSGNVKTIGKISALLELGAGFNMEYTGLENIYLNGTIMGYTKQEMNNKISSILEFAEIGQFIHQPVKMYSSGMFARLAFALAINVKPDILIVDESLAVGDIRFQSKCFEKFKELKKQGVTILFVSHDVQSVRNFCDKAIWIDKGVVREVGNTVDITSKYIEYMNSESIQDSSIDDNTTEFPTMEEQVFNPIKRWGRQVGLINYVDLVNSMGKSTSSIQYGEEIKIKVGFHVPHTIDINTLSIAISIKNVQGIDLLVSTTFDDNIVRVSETDCHYEASFVFDNLLNSGDYILVVALEDRSQSMPQYYDFIEGAKYLKVYTNKQLFGLVNLPVYKSVKRIGSEH